LKKCGVCGYKIHPDFELKVSGESFHKTCIEVDFTDFAICQLCNKHFKIISHTHLKSIHNMSMTEYRLRYGRVTSSTYNKVLAKSSKMKSEKIRQPKGPGRFFTKEDLEKLNSRIIREMVKLFIGIRISKKDDGINALCGIITHQNTDSINREDTNFYRVVDNND